MDAILDFAWANPLYSSENFGVIHAAFWKQEVMILILSTQYGHSSTKWAGNILLN